MSEYKAWDVLHVRCARLFGRKLRYSGGWFESDIEGFKYDLEPEIIPPDDEIDFRNVAMEDEETDGRHREWRNNHLHKSYDEVIIELFY